VLQEPVFVPAGIFHDKQRELQIDAMRPAPPAKLGEAFAAIVNLDAYPAAGTALFNIPTPPDSNNNKQVKN